MLVQGWQIVGRRHGAPMAGLLSRRLYPQADNHQLGTLAKLRALPSAGRAHRALADAAVTSHPLLKMQLEVSERFALPLRGAPASHALLAALQRAARGGLERCVEREMAVAT